MVQLTLNTYIILLQEAKRRQSEQLCPLDHQNLEFLAKQTGVRFLNSYAFGYGAYDAMLICQAQDNATMAEISGKLYGWDCTSLLASPAPSPTITLEPPAAISRARAFTFDLRPSPS